MAKKKKEEEKVEKAPAGTTPNEIANAFFKDAKGYHYNDNESPEYKVPFSSLILTAETDGGLGPGCHRFIGKTTGGKTHCAFDLMKKFLEQKKKRRGVYFKCEGRLSKNVRLRVGIDFTTDKTKWEDGQCLIVKCNIFDYIFAFMRNVVMYDSSGTEYFFLIDSVDNMIKKADFDKGFDEAHQVAGGAVVTGLLLKMVGIAMAEKGHIALFISQFREIIRASDNKKPDPQRQGNSSGGHALEHQADWVLDFQSRTQAEYFREKDEFGNEVPVGHMCKLKILKSDNENYSGDPVLYPIRYGRKDGNSVWVEQEIFELASKLRLIEATSWVKFSEPILAEMAEAGITPEKQFHGQAAFRKYLEENKEVTQFMFDKLVSILTGKTKSEQAA